MADALLAHTRVWTNRLLSDASAQRQQTGYAHQDQYQWDNEQRRRRDTTARGQRIEVAVAGPLREVDAGDTWGNALPFYGLGVQEYEAFLVSPEELVQRDILDSCSIRSRPIVFCYEGVQGNSHRRHSTGFNIRACTTPVEMVDVLNAFFWQTLHVQLDLYATLDVREGGSPAHPRIAERCELEVYVLRFLG